MLADVTSVYDQLKLSAESYGIRVAESALGKDKAGAFDGPSITINRDNDRQEQAFFLAHSIGSVARWALASQESAVIYAELREAKKRRRDEPGRFERALDGFCRFEEIASEHAVWLFANIGAGDAEGPYTTFARADLDAMLVFHRTDEAPCWPEFFALWQQRAARADVDVRPYRPRPIPPFRPVKIQTQEIVQEKE